MPRYNSLYFTKYNRVISRSPGSRVGTKFPVTPTPSVPKITQTPTPTFGLSPTPTPSITRTCTPTPTFGLTQTPTPSITRTCTLTPTFGLSQTPTPSITRTCTPTLTRTPTPSITRTLTPTITRTPTPSITRTLTPTITRTCTPTPTPSTATNNINDNILFDKSSFIGIIGEPYLSALNVAVDRWENFIKINPAIVEAIRTDIDEFFDGIYIQIYNISNLGGSSYIASCGPYNYVDIQPVGPGTQFCSINFQLNINTYFAVGASPYFYTQTDWENILTHELGHALGIGVYWDPFFEPQGAHPPENNFLSGVYYKGIQNAYNNLTSLNRTQTPLEDGGDPGTTSAHWENNYRSPSYSGSQGVSYPGINNELMNGFYNGGSNPIMSTLSISACKDFGYIEKNPGTSEGTPTIINNIVPGLDIETSSNSPVKLSCGCISEKPERIAIINSNNKEVLISPVIVN